MKILSKNRLGSRRGNAMVEFALASLILIPTFIGTFQFGYTFYVYNLLCTQVRAGARYASTRTFRCKTSTSITNFKTAVKNMVMYGDSNPGGSATVLEPGLTEGQIVVDLRDAGGVSITDNTRVPAFVIVSTNYSVNALVSTVNFTGKPRLQFPYTGQWAPAETEP